VDRDTSNDRNGEQAVWRDLVARLELPQAIDPADAPWPDRENLTSARHASSQDTPRQGHPRQDHPRQDEPGEHQPRQGPAGQGTGGQGPGRQGPARQVADAPRQDDDERKTRHARDLPVSRRRVIRPTSFLRFAEASQYGKTDGGRPRRPAGRHAVPPARLSQEDQACPPHGRQDRRDGRPAGQAGQDGRSGSDDGEGSGVLGGGLEFQDLADLEFFDEDDERYVPPRIPPQPKLDPVARGAWTALFGGPGYLFVATTLSWQVPGWAELGAIIAFITGFVVLVSRLGDGPSRKDGPDQGAVV
jgi:hypothetical protein